MNIIQNKVFVESINNALNNRMHHINNFRITEEIIINTILIKYHQFLNMS